MQLFPVFPQDSPGFFGNRGKVWGDCLKFPEIGVDKGKWLCYNNPALGRLAQLVEHALDVRRVSGSSPLSSTKKDTTQLGGVFFGMVLLITDANPSNADVRWTSAATSSKTGERTERCLWQMKRGERVAAVGEGRRRFIAEDIRRVPQQGGNIYLRPKGANADESVIVCPSPENATAVGGT